MSQELKETFIALVRLGIGNASEVQMHKSVDWEALQALTYEQGLSAVVVDGVGKLPADLRPPKTMLLQWIGEIFQAYEYWYEMYKHAIAEMAAFYNAHGFKMMILKGYACSLDWPRPDHRPCGDIDIWQFGKQKEADAILAKEKGIEIDNSHHHHTVFYWRDFMVENHYDFINVHHHKSNSELENIFKELGQDDSHFGELFGEKVFLPSPNLHALFLLRHCMTDFASAVLTLRQVLDWGFFVQKQGPEVDWTWLVGMLNKFHMRDFFNCINAICVEDLAFDIHVFPYIQFDPILKLRVFNEILSPKYPLEEPNGFVRRLFYKFRRWKGNEWKHKMCYNESMWSAFWSGVWNHLLKPSSI